MAQISASVRPEIIEAIKKIQAKEKQESFSQMVETLLQEAVDNRKKK